MDEYDCFYDGSIDDTDDDGNDIGDDDNSSVEISGTNEEHLGDAQTAKREDSMNTYCNNWLMTLFIQG